MAENTKNSNCSSGTSPVSSKRYPSHLSDSDSKRICLHDSRGPTPFTSSKAPQDSIKDVEGLFRTTGQELVSNVEQPCTLGINQIAPPSVDETTLHVASPRISQEASQVATEHITLEAVPSKTNSSIQETTHIVCKISVEERLPDINQEILNPVIEKVTLDAAQKSLLPDAENTIEQITSNNIQDISEKTALGSPQKSSYLAAEQITTNVAKSKLQILSQESIEEVYETTTEKIIPLIAQEAFQEIIEGTSPEVSQVTPQINIENSMDENDQEVLQVPEKSKLKEISSNTSPATTEEVTPAVVPSDIHRISQDSAQENTQVGTKSNTLEVSQESSQITTEQPSPDFAESKIKDSSEAHKQEYSQAISENTVNEEAQKVPELKTKAIVGDVSKEPSQTTTEKTLPDVAKSNIQDLSQANKQEFPQIITENTIKDEAHKVPQLSTENVVRDVSNESSQLPTKDKLKETARDTSPATIEEVTAAVVPSDSISQDSAQENTQVGTKNDTPEVSQELSQITTEQPRHEITESKIHDLSQANKHECSQVITENTINEEAQKVPELKTKAIVRDVSKESSQLPTKDKLKETARDIFSTDIEGITPVVVSGDIHSTSQETVQENTQIATEEIKSEISHTHIPIISDSKPSEARRKSRVVEEKKRGQRLFGGLLSTLSQSSPNGQQRRRLEIEKRQLERAKIRKVQDNVNKAERIAKLNAARIKGHSIFKKESFHIHKANVLAMANFLCTKTEPKLYYKPWELLPEQEEQVKSQIASASAKFKGSESNKDDNDQVGLKDGEKLNEISKEVVCQPHTEPPNITADADAHNATTSVIPPNTNDVVDSPNKDSKVEEREREEHNCEVMVENEEDTVIY